MKNKHSNEESNKIILFLKKKQDREEEIRRNKYIDYIFKDINKNLYKDNYSPIKHIEFLMELNVEDFDNFLERFDYNQGQNIKAMLIRNVEMFENIAEKNKNQPPAIKEVYEGMADLHVKLLERVRDSEKFAETHKKQIRIKH